MTNQTTDQSSGAVSATQTDASGSDMLDLGALISTLWRGKFFIFFVTALAIAAGAYYAYLVATPKFGSTAVVMLNAREEQVVDLESVIGGLSADASVVNTEVEVLKSRSLLTKVVTKLELEKDPEFNRFLRTPSVIDRAKLVTKRTLGLTQEQAPLSPEDEAERTREGTIDGLLGKLRIRNVPQSLVFQVTATTTNSKKSALVANTLVNLYILNQLEVKFDATEQATGWLTSRVNELQVALETAESEVKEFSAKTDLISSDSLLALEIQLKDIRDRIEDTKIAEQNARQLREGIRGADTRDALAEVLSDPQLTRLLPRVSTPSIAQAFDDRVAQITARTQLEVDRAVTQIQALTESQVGLEAQIASQSEDLIALQQLSREAEASRLLYEYFLARLKETSAQQGIQQADSRVLSNAVVPTLASSPRRPLIIAISGILGLVVGAMWLLLREARTDTFRTAQMLERQTGFPVMGQITMLPGRRRKDAISYLAKKPTSAAAEAVRNLRTSILLSDVDNPPQVILTCSSLPGEGKTTLSLALAQNMAAMGKRVLVIEGDIRRLVFSKYFQGTEGSGLISVLEGKTPLKAAAHLDALTGAYVLQGERSKTNAADLFSSQSFHDMMAEARASFDVIVIDTPPVLVVPDARILAQHADAVLFLVSWDKTRKTQVKEALSMFDSVNHKVSGLVLNRISARGMKRYGYGGQYGAYSSYGRKYYVN